MLSELFIRFNMTLGREEIEKLLNESKEVIETMNKEFDPDVQKDVNVKTILMIHECGLIKCDCFEDDNYDRCVCGFAIVADLFNQICLDRFDTYIARHLDSFRITTRVRPM